MSLRVLRFAALSFVALALGCSSRAVGSTTTESSLSRASTTETETETGETEMTEDSETTSDCPEIECRELGWSCPGPNTSECCDGLPCEPANVEDGTYWSCGGVLAGGVDVGCSDGAPSEGCEWIELAGCEDHGRIDEVCGEGRVVDRLRRCDDSCFRPDELYQVFRLCSCDTTRTSDACVDAACDCPGPSWAAVLCCAS